MLFRSSQRFRKWAAEVFGADLRALAALRVGIAGILLFDLVQRATDLVPHYTDFGVAPRAFVIEQSSSRWFVSLHFLSGTWQMQAILFLVASIFAVSLMVGYRTRLATIASWALFASLVTRNPYVVSGADSMLRVMLFWGMFLPWGAYYSVDRAWSRPSETSQSHCFSFGTAAYVMQIIFVYWFTVLLKSGPEWRTEGTAIYYALSLDYMATSVGTFLLQFPLLLRMLTHSVFWFEIIGPLLLLSPVWTGPIRTLAVVGFILLHLGIAATLQIGLFPAISIVAVWFFLPAWFWEKLAAGLKRAESADVRIYYDADCELCRKYVRVIQTFLALPGSVVAATQSGPLGKMDGHEPWTVEAQGARYVGYRGIPHMIKASPIFWWTAPILELAPTQWIGRRIYSSLSHHRTPAYIGKPTVSAGRSFGMNLPWHVNVGVALILVYLLLWNIGTLPSVGIKIPERLTFLGYILRIDQNWKMFAPYPPSEDGWYVVPGKLSDGTLVDLFRGGSPIDWNKPEPVSAIYKNHHRRKYGEALLRIKALPPTYAEYLCRNWNRSHAGKRRLEEVEIFYIREWTQAKSGYITPEKLSLLKFQCPAA